jgi:Sec-independent protein translocase protein TatA
MSTTSWIVLAVVGVVVLALVAYLVRTASHRRRAVKADRIRDEVQEERQRLDRRAAVAAETEAKARAAQAEADAKAAEAARLQDRAASHRDEVDSTRERLAARREHADKIDPRVKRSGDAGDEEPDRVVVDDPRAARHQAR